MIWTWLDSLINRLIQTIVICCLGVVCAFPSFSQQVSSAPMTLTASECIQIQGYFRVCSNRKIIYVHVIYFSVLSSPPDLKYWLSSVTDELPIRTSSFVIPTAYFGHTSTLPSNNVQVWQFIKICYNRLSGSLSLRSALCLSIFDKTKCLCFLLSFRLKHHGFSSPVSSWQVYLRWAFSLFLFHVVCLKSYQDAIGIVIQTSGRHRKRRTQDFFCRSKFEVLDGC